MDGSRQLPESPGVRLRGRGVLLFPGAGEEEGAGVVEHDTQVREHEVEDKVKCVGAPYAGEKPTRRPRELDVNGLGLHGRAQRPDVILVEGFTGTILQHGHHPAEGGPAPDGRVVFGRNPLALQPSLCQQM